MFNPSFSFVSFTESCFTQVHTLPEDSLHLIAGGLGVIKLLSLILMRDNFGRTCFVPELTEGLAKADIG